MIFLAEITYNVPISECKTFTQTKHELRIVIADDQDKGIDKIKKHLQERGVSFVDAKLSESIV